jgi:hypothetical protein
MKKILFVLFIFIYALGFSQIDKLNSKEPLVKDPYFKKETNVAVQPGQKVRFIHSDLFERKPDMYGGNPFFTGNVQFEHQGAMLTADRVIFYEKENFAKAIGNVLLVTSDGNRITSNEMEYDGNTQRGIARGKVVLTDAKQTISTDVLYYDRVKNTAYFNSGRPSDFLRKRKFR